MLRRLKTHKVWLVLSLPPAVVALYTCSILFRVGLAEQNLYGRNYLIPFTPSAYKYAEPPTADSHGATYTYIQRGKTVHVHKQLINSFQHAYGSALASFELGNCLADLLFRANEYMESTFCRNSGTEYFFLDTKKDLANNAVGRDIGARARE